MSRGTPRSPASRVGRLFPGWLSLSPSPRSPALIEARTSATSSSFLAPALAALPRTSTLVCLLAAAALFGTLLLSGAHQEAAVRAARRGLVSSDSNAVNPLPGGGPLYHRRRSFADNDGTAADVQQRLGAAGRTAKAHSSRISGAQQAAGSAAEAAAREKPAGVLRAVPGGFLIVPSPVVPANDGPPAVALQPNTAGGEAAAPAASNSSDLSAGSDNADTPHDGSDGVDGGSSNTSSSDSLATGDSNSGPAALFPHPTGLAGLPDDSQQPTDGDASAAAPAPVADAEATAPAPAGGAMGRGSAPAELQPPALPTGLQLANLGGANATSVRIDEEPAPLKYPVWWFAPFWSGTGYSSEANNYVLTLLRSKLLRRQDVWVAHHGDNVRDQVVLSMDEPDRRDLQAMERGVDSRPSIVLCHSLPTNWMLPEPMGWAGAQCPPDPTKHGYVYLIGRTMFETDRLPRVFVPRCNAMNEVWVPSEFSRDVFIRSGVHASKIVVVPEGVNTTWFDPALYEPAEFPQGDLVFGSPAPAGAPQPFRFLSTFKWEPRKGWDVLLEAYLSEFSELDNVELYIITKPFVGGTDFRRSMHLWVARRAAQRRALTPNAKAEAFNATAHPRLYVIHRHISDPDFPRFYKAADAFVLPSRGEGWGRPHVEAMSMGLPIISTNWSGITAYLDDTVGYPLLYDGLVTVSDNSVWWFKGLKWASPSVTHLRDLMRHVYENREEARAKGVLARQRMVERFSPEVLARQVSGELRRIQGLIPDIY